MRSEHIIFCDFDGTITQEDTIKNFLTTFTGGGWLRAEKEWIDGKIGSRECLEVQLNLAAHVSKNEIDDFLSQVKIDDYFIDFYKFIKKEKIDFYIISDGLDYFIKTILEANGIEDAIFYANHLEFKNGKFALSFPNQNPRCKRNSGTCKCKIAQQYTQSGCETIYIGDGLSDCCVSDNIDIIFAKDDLLKYCKTNYKKNYIEFRNFKDVKRALETIKGGLLC